MSYAATTGFKYDDGKLRMDLIPPSAIVSLAKALTHGAEKYVDRNWERGLSWGRVYAALQRHLNAWWNGEETDRESKLHHLEHAICNLAFLIEFQHTHPELDTRACINAKDK